MWIPMPYDTCVIVGKSLKVSGAMCKSGSNTIVEAGVVACHMKNFEKLTIVCLRRLLQMPIISHFVEAQMQMLIVLHVIHVGEETIVGLI